MFLKPVNGALITDPVKGDFLPESGREVDKNQYWLRRINDGDVTELKKDIKNRGKK